MFMRKCRFEVYIKSLLLLLSVVCIGFESKMSAHAAGVLDTRRGFYWAATMDDEGELLFLSPAIAAQGYGEDWDWTDIEILTGEYPAYLMEEEVSTRLLVDSGSLELEYMESDSFTRSGAAGVNGEGFVYSWWSLADEPADMEDIEVLSLADSIRQGDTAIFIGRSMEEGDNQLGIYTKEVVLAELHEDYAEDDSAYHYDCLSINDYPQEELVYPAMLVNEEDELVAVVFEEEMIVAIADTWDFYEGNPEESGDGQESPEASEPSEPEASPEPAEQQPSQEPSGTDAEQENIAAPLYFDDDSDSGEGYGLIVGIVIACIIVAVVVVVILVVMKKKKTKSASDIGSISNGSDNYRPVDDIGPTVPMDAEAAPVSPIGQQEQPSFWVVAKGGYMDGRVYPMGKEEITIGRNAASVIRYPDNTAGVSRVHAKLYRQGGKLMLMDCNSTSGTFLKRLGKLMPMTPIEVQHGDIFYIGEKKNSFEIRNGGN